MALASQTPILVVDDDAELRELLCETLREEGYALVAEARDGLEALLRLQLSPVPMVTLCDYRMPRLDGLRLLTTLATGSPALQRHVGILMTADDRLLARTWGESRRRTIACLYKPFHLDELLAAVTTASGRLRRKTTQRAGRIRDRRDGRDVRRRR
jgi:two-component system, response regulator FlrC